MTLSSALTKSFVFRARNDDDVNKSLNFWLRQRFLLLFFSSSKSQVLSYFSVSQITHCCELGTYYVEVSLSFWTPAQRKQQKTGFCLDWLHPAPQLQMQLKLHLRCHATHSYARVEPERVWSYWAAGSSSNSVLLLNIFWLSQLSPWLIFGLVLQCLELMIGGVWIYWALGHLD